MMDEGGSRRARVATATVPPNREKRLQIQLSTDPHIDGGRPMAEHVQETVGAAMQRFAERVTRVDAHLSSAGNQATAGADTIHCTLEARVTGLEPVVVKAHASAAHLAIQSAVDKLKRALSTALGKEGAQRSKAPPEPAEPPAPETPPA